MLRSQIASTLRTACRRQLPNPLCAAVVVTPQCRPLSGQSEPKIFKGLYGVHADYTAVSTVAGVGHDHGLTYRGYAIEDLAQNCEFEEVAHLLLRKSLPSAAELAAYKEELAPNRALDPRLCTVLESLPATSHPMDVMRTTASVMGCLDPEGDRLSGKSDTAGTADKLMPAYVSAMCYWYHFANSGKRIKFNTDPKDNLATAFLKMLRDDQSIPDKLHVKVIDASFILYAEHDFAASTFTSRVIASTMSDTYSCISGAIGALRGPLHGGANEAVMYMLEDVKSIEEGEAKINDMLAKKQLIMGFGHRLYKTGDPRNAVFKKLSKELSERPDGHPMLFAVSDRIEALMEERKRMYPNADFFAASAYHQVGVPTPFFTPLFVVSRTAGWCAHILEQIGGNGKNVIIRPTSIYNGPEMKDFLPIEQR